MTARPVRSTSSTAGTHLTGDGIDGVHSYVDPARRQSADQGGRREIADPAFVVASATQRVQASGAGAFQNVAHQVAWPATRARCSASAGQIVDSQGTHPSYSCWPK